MDTYTDGTQVLTGVENVDQVIYNYAKQLEDNQLTRLEYVKEAKFGKTMFKILEINEKHKKYIKKWKNTDFCFIRWHTRRDFKKGQVFIVSHLLWDRYKGHTFIKYLTLKREKNYKPNKKTGEIKKFFL